MLISLYQGTKCFTFTATWHQQLKDLNFKRYFDLGPIAIKRCQIFPLRRKFEFPANSVNTLFKFSAQGRDLELFVGNGTKVKIPSEIKPTLAHAGWLHILFPYIVFFFCLWFHAFLPWYLTFLAWKKVEVLQHSRHNVSGLFWGSGRLLKLPCGPMLYAIINSEREFLMLCSFNFVRFFITYQFKKKIRKIA